MCLAAPSKVIEVRDGVAVTECFGLVREVSASAPRKPWR
jgi:hydrogenase expression/formation protein HypC